MVQELRDMLGLEISLNPTVSRAEGKPSTGQKIFVVVGDSHARRVSESLLNQGEEVVNFQVKRGDYPLVSSKIETICAEHVKGTWQ
jgi:hypothetical protein